MKRGVKITIASIAALTLVAVGIIAAPLLKNLLNDIANPAYKETKSFRMTAGPTRRIPRFTSRALRSR